MKRARRTSLSVWVAVTAGILSIPAWKPALAALGEDVSSVEQDRQQMRGGLQVTSAAEGYTIHAIRTPGNTVVKEYVSAAGRVFAVTWQGPLLPDLRQTLGSYFAQYQEAASAPHAGHRRLRIEQPDLVVHSHGHMRAFFGEAWVPSLLPPNFSVAKIN
ncbi:MAG TPA: DUF2844 domain-containing protein [Steroidobacteraceae bacterium]|nr:DUF2844 domain-containing protein [Steroidobacteraceae bacterium]